MIASLALALVLPLAVPQEICQYHPDDGANFGCVSSFEANLVYDWTSPATALDQQAGPGHLIVKYKDDNFDEVILVTSYGSRHMNVFPFNYVRVETGDVIFVGSVEEPMVYPLGDAND